MKKRLMTFVAATAVVAATMPAFAAPLFPDVKDDHWAKDAVAALAAKGLLEGYPDGTFKGDRAATRWEVAMIVARLLAKMEQAHATFATKAEMDELRKLVNALKDELDALGVRVTNLEESVGRLDKRVTELERITFYGYVDTRGSMSTFYNTGNEDNSNRAFGGGIGGANFSSPGVPYVNYNRAVGSAGGALLSPQVNGELATMDYRNGRPLLNGTGFTMRGVLGLRIRVSDDIDAGAEFSAFTAQGNNMIDQYWGVTAPFLSNPWNASGSDGINQLNQPWTRMTLDNFWVVHNPSKTKLVLGAFSEKNIDSLIYAGTYNPGAYGPRFLDSFGFNVSGKVDVSNAGVLRWEALGTRLGDFSAYNSYLLGADVEFEFEGGAVKANVARVNQDGNSFGGVRTDSGVLGTTTTSGGVGNAGLFPNANVNVGRTLATGGTGWSPLQWVNPPGFYANQMNLFQQGAAGSGTVDPRPITGTAALNDGVQSGAFGPQGMLSYGLQANYKWDIGGGDAQVYIGGNYAHSDYKPSQNSSYQVGGNAFKIEAGANLLDGDLDLGIQYLRVDPTYDPFILAYQSGFGVNRLPDLNYFSGLYSLHDTQAYPHNREGVRFSGQWRFNQRRGLLWAKAGFLDQVDTSLYTVRQLTGSLGPVIPNNQVVGFAPGFIDPVFSGFAHPAVYGAGTANSFTETLAPLENPKGRHTQYGIGASYKFDDPRVKIDVGYNKNEFVRNSSLGAGFGGSQNQVNMNIDSIHGQVAWEVNDKWTLRGGMDYTTISGHYDPAGLYNNFAIAANSINFQNLDSRQMSPYLGFDYDVSANTQWNMDLRYYTTSNAATAPINPARDSVGVTNHYGFDGYQISTQFKVKF